MSQWYQYLVDRLRALFLTEVGLELEAQFLTREAERKADLLRKAIQYEEEGFSDIAENLRVRAGEISIEQPLASVCPAVQHLELRATGATMLESAAATESNVALLPTDKSKKQTKDQQQAEQFGDRKGDATKAKSNRK